MSTFLKWSGTVVCCVFFSGGVVLAASEELQKNIYNPAW